MTEKKTYNTLAQVEKLGGKKTQSRVCIGEHKKGTTCTIGGKNVKIVSPQVPLTSQSVSR